MDRSLHKPEIAFRKIISCLTSKMAVRLLPIKGKRRIGTLNKKPKRNTEYSGNHIKTIDEKKFPTREKISDKNLSINTWSHHIELTLILARP